MLFFVFIAVLVIGIIGINIFDEFDHGALHLTSCIVARLAGFAIVGSLFIFAYSYIGIDAYIAENKQIYESLVYQYENDVFDNDDDIVGKKELYNQIQDWNKDLAYHQNIQDDFWVGVYYPNIFDQFEFIEYKKE